MGDTELGVRKTDVLQDTAQDYKTKQQISREVKKTQMKKSLKDSGDIQECKLQRLTGEPVKEQNKQQATKNKIGSEQQPKSLTGLLD